MARYLALLLALALRLAYPAFAETDQGDVSAVNVLFKSLNAPPQLTGWSSTGGDPCGDDWKGVKCSGSSVTEISLSGLGLTGSLGYQLSSLTSVTYFDMSKNNLKGDIPYQLPPKVEHLNLAENAFTGGIPYSISQMTDLKYLNLHRNQLNGQLNDIFGKLDRLSEMYLSFNQLSGNLPPSLGSLKSLKTLHLQNNQFSGSIKGLANLPLEDLNVENNQFNGWIPNKLKNIDTLQIGGNSWSSGAAPPGMDKASNTNSHTGGKKGVRSVVNGAVIAGTVIAVLVISLILLALIKRRSLSSSHYIDDQSSQNISSTPLVSRELGLKGYSSSIDIKALETPPSMDLRPPPEPYKLFSDNEFAVKLNPKQSTNPVSITAYSIVDLQAATGSFSASRLLGQGTIGSVYKAKYADGKVLAVKKIDLINLSGGTSSYDFMELVSGISKLRHPNITELLGYCLEPRYHLLIYEFQMNGSLHDFLHLSDEYSKPLTWDTRVRIALGTARALEYLHGICSPSVIHKNMKSANILLDSELNPHLSDCGLAVFYEDTSENLGPGYNAPECTKPSACTMKSDVYSFGVVMLELLTGCKPFDSSKPIMERTLVRWAAPQLHDINVLTQMVDPALRGLYPPKSLSRFADVIALCIQPEPEFRPSMSEVVQSLDQCVHRTGIDKRSRLSTSCRSDDSESSYH
ncbi:protein STRUBBELIG-RECEPTOR FAMILY 5-like [Phoenix dactylifera]|uniref:Protein STRUBBELIG-RECEPTOR FAMILY 5-like n=1 Tax=Phoenix dactylifera TaxID=42345 RepID=A0A8B7BMQ8_PHODC|nr:protein STRUBBELIG-RECEPTOR FAMILY 5-like [Phoenix dactylifera]